MGEVSEVRRHYEGLLAPHYSWMMGVPFADKVAEQRAILEASRLLPRRRRTALDLGAGPGFQTAALRELGFERVVAVDLSPTLLAELGARLDARPVGGAGPLPVSTVEADLLAHLEQLEPATVDAVVCMGDTLTHLAARADVVRLVEAAARALAPGGALLLSFRDLTPTLGGLDRFLPIHGDAQRVMTCFLEYEPDAVLVHDLIHLREGTGWRLTTGAYRKLRLAPNWVEAQLRSGGLVDVGGFAAGRLVGLGGRKAEGAGSPIPDRGGPDRSGADQVGAVGLGQAEGRAAPGGAGAGSAEPGAL